MDNGYQKLKVYQLAYKPAIKVFHLSKRFPKEETYSLTDQIRRASRSICVNIAEGYRKRIYPKHFKSKMTDADSECSETMVWLNFSRDCNYITVEECDSLYKRFEEVDKMLGNMIKNPRKFLPRN